MGFNVRMFLDDLLDMIENIHNGQEEDLIEYILDQAEYARQCGVID